MNKKRICKKCGKELETSRYHIELCYNCRLELVKSAKELEK